MPLTVLNNQPPLLKRSASSSNEIVYDQNFREDWSTESNPRTLSHSSEHDTTLNVESQNCLNEAMLESHRKLVEVKQGVDKQVIAKVEKFLLDNPLNTMFLKREKGRLPYSVFRPQSLDTYFLKSLFSGRPPTAFFPYPSYVKINRKCDRVRKYKKEEVENLFMAFKILDNTNIYNAVVFSCKNAGFCMLDSTNSEMFNL